MSHATPTSWPTLITNLNVWKKGKQRAVHKPLLILMILARAKADGDNIFAYNAIYPKLATLLRAFGPWSAARPGTEFPFWHLKNDGFWKIINPDLFPRRKGKDQATHKGLRDNDAAAYVPLPLWHTLKAARGLVPQLACHLLAAFWPATYHDDILAAVGLDIVSLYGLHQADHTHLVIPATPPRRRSPDFRPSVLAAYDRKCAMCGFDGQLADTIFGLEACHVQWFAYDGPDDVSNGLALCSLHHAALDRGALTIAEDRRTVLVSELVRGSDVVAIMDMHRRPLSSPVDAALLDPGVLRWHQKNVLRGKPLQ